ncbi:MAG: hypothetical protein K2X99_09055 [Gemmatimonadaceae bacterium]|nr:hypothetical protein [Gemmatimonadaceae bacterium]
MRALAFLLGVAAALPAQSTRPIVTVSLTPTTVRVGEPVELRVRVQAPLGARVRFPALPDTSDAIEPIDPRAVVDGASTGVVDRTAVWRIAAWRAGTRRIALAPIEVAWEGRRERFPLIAPALTVSSVLPADTTDRDPRPARALADAPARWWQWVAAAAILLVIGWLLRRQRRAARARTDVDAWVELRTRWKAIDAMALVEAGELARAVAVETEAMRAYLTRRFPAASTGMASREFVATLAAHGLPVLPDEVGSLLLRADAIKFAAAPVSAAECAEFARLARAVARDVQTAYEARLRAAQRPKRKAAA